MITEHGHGCTTFYVLYNGADHYDALCSQEQNVIGPKVVAPKQKSFVSPKAKEVVKALPKVGYPQEKSFVSPKAIRRFQKPFLKLFRNKRGLILQKHFLKLLCDKKKVLFLQHYQKLRFNHYLQKLLVSPLKEQMNQQLFAMCVKEAIFSIN